MTDTLLSDAQNLEAAAAHYQDALHQASLDAAQAAASAAARDQAHTDLQAAIALVVADAQALDAAPPAAPAAPPAAPAAPPAA